MNDTQKSRVYWGSVEQLMRWASDELDEAVADGNWAGVELVVSEIDAVLERTEGDVEMSSENRSRGTVNGTVIALAVLAVILILGLCGMLTLLMMTTDVESAMLLAQMVV